MSLEQLCFSFKGRVNRSTYWIFTGIAPLIPIITLAAGGIFSELGVSDIVIAIITVAFYAMIIVLTIVHIAVTVKRLHDTNRAGVYVLLGLIPLIGTIWVLVVCGFLKGTDGENNYGAPPE